MTNAPTKSPPLIINPSNKIDVARGLNKNKQYQQEK